MLFSWKINNVLQMCFGQAFQLCSTVWLRCATEQVYLILDRRDAYFIVATPQHVAAGSERVNWVKCTESSVTAWRLTAGWG